MSEQCEESDYNVTRRPRTNLRWMMLLILFLGMAIQSLDRVNLSAALPVMSKQFHMNDVSKGVVLSAFFWCYAIFNLPAGYIIDRLRPHKSFSLIGAWWSIVTILTSLANGVASLIGLRALLGVGEAGDFPTATATVREWFPQKERALASGIFSVGNDAGIIIALPLSAFLLIHFGWQAVFVGCGIIGAVWTLIWWKFYRAPDRHPRISTEEKSYIQEESRLKAGDTSEVKKPWLHLLGYRKTWVLSIGYFCYTYLYGFFLTWLPTYLVKARHFSIAEVGMYGFIPSIFALVGGPVGGIYSDFLMKKSQNTNISRKIPIGIGMVIGAISIVATAVVPSVLAAIVLLSSTTFFMRAAYASIWSLPSDVSPSSRYTASIAGIMNAAGNMGGGVIAPIITGVLLSSTHFFTVPLIVAGIVVIVGSLLFVFGVGSIEPLWKERNA
ncbi:MFS transporter [Alicyclobacillus tolerans]|uniref:MFS transporter n=1 Tax=Alicyclobacillus tolerans TaxID=90970 RepID=UPI001F15BE37|nr:MFS transporter [Alicyclobacillus tolerans]MCF8568514.1 MFS transporter [Alicyclobacillus tolerans]